MSGYCAAAIAVLIWAAYPVATRGGLAEAFTPQELVALRFGIGALVFLPFLLLHVRRIGRAAWLQGVPLALFQGAGMGALVICGLQFAPASHAAALGPGANPAWVAVLGFLLFARQPSARMIIGATLCAAGVLILALWSASGHDLRVLAGDAMFLTASGLGALYVLQLRRWGIAPIEGAAIVSLYSALVIVPWYAATSSGAGLLRFAPYDLLWQTLWQGVLIGSVALVALNQAITSLGAERSSALLALVPVLTALLALIFLGEVPSPMEIAALLLVSAGVSMQAGRPLEALQRSARPAGYRVRGSAP
jgi:drug/metabolite transporter (DMT)-like permease